MIRAVAAAFALALAAPTGAFETLAVLAAGDPPAGPDADLAELAHELRAACRDRIGGVMDVPTMRARLLGQRSNATVTELDRAYGGALAVYQNGEFESAVRTLRAIVEDLEALPESDEAYSQWVRAQLRFAHAAMTIGREREAEEAMQSVLRTDPTIAPEPELYSPTYRRRYEAARAKVRSLPARRLQVLAEGFGGQVYVNGRFVGAAPVSMWLPAGVYRIGGASGSLHVPSFRVSLVGEDRAVVLDFGLAEAVRVAGGPGLAIPVSRRPDAIVRAGAWLGVDRVISVSRQAEGDAVFLLGSMYDVRNGALLREGSVRTVAGSVPAANLGALATFLLTGQSSRDVKDRTDVARVPISPPVFSVPMAAIAPEPSPPAPSVPAAGSRAASASATASVPGPGSVTPAGAGAVPVPGARGGAPSAPGSASAGSARGSASAVTPPAQRAVAGSSQTATSGKRSGAPSVVRIETTAPPPAPTGSAASASGGRTAAADLSPRSFTPPAPTAGSLALAGAPVAAPAPSPVSSGSGPEPSSARRWLRPAAYGSALLVGVFTGVAVQQAITAQQARADAAGMVGPGGSLAPGSDPTRYAALRSDANAATRNAYLSAGAAAVFAVTAGVLGWSSRAPADGAGASAPPAVRF